MKKFLLTFLFIISSFIGYSQEVNFGLSLGTGLSSQTLQSSNSPYTAGKTWNTIGGLPYRVDSYLGYNAGLMVELFFDLSTTDIDDKVKKSKIGIKTGVNYSSQGVTVEDVNKTRFENNMVYLNYSYPLRSSKESDSDDENEPISITYLRIK